MKNKNLFCIILVLLINLNLSAQDKINKNKSNNQSNFIEKDFVPDAKTAIKIAEAIWLPIYGEKIYKEMPFIATLKNSKVWIVKGTLRFTKGGTAYIEIQKKDCKILEVYHEK